MLFCSCPYPPYFLLVRTPTISPFPSRAGSTRLLGVWGSTVPQLIHFKGTQIHNGMQQEDSDWADVTPVDSTVRRAVGRGADSNDLNKVLCRST